MSQILRLVGDVHGKIDNYLAIIKQVDYSIQLGDLGFLYEGLELVSSERHKVLAGNHDNYTKEGDRFVRQTPHFLGDFGLHQIQGAPPIFFLRGGSSIDKQQRRIGLDWWPEEELGYASMLEALEFYRDSRPEMVISHECPAGLLPYVGTKSQWNGQPILPSTTSRLLQEMWLFHQPQYWFFGHHHQKWAGSINGTSFMCLDILSIHDIKLVK